MNSSPPAPHVCRVCRQPLGYFETNVEDEAGKWFHGAVSDHDPVPVPRLEMDSSKLRPVCDFCSTESDLETSWVYPAQAFAVQGRLDDAVHTLADDGEGWGACRACHLLIAAGDREGLAARAASIAERRHGVAFDELLPHIRLAHDTYFAAATQPPYPAREYRQSN